MEVDIDDELLEAQIQVRSKGPPPDVTHHLPSSNTNNSNSYYQKSSNHKNFKYHNSSTSNREGNTNTSLIPKLTSNNHISSSENQPLLSGGEGVNLSDDQMEALSDYVHLSCNHFEDDPEFNEVIKQVEFAIDHNMLPQRIYEGSSGSYFVKNSNSVIFFSSNFLKINFRIKC